jgi:hypothetical protein
MIFSEMNEDDDYDECCLDNITMFFFVLFLDAFINLKTIIEFPNTLLPT